MGKSGSRWDREPLQDFEHTRKVPLTAKCRQMGGGGDEQQRAGYSNPHMDLSQLRKNLGRCTEGADSKKLRRKNFWDWMSH